MDKQSTLGFILIGVLLLGWMWLQAPSPPEVERIKVDTTAVVPPAVPQAKVQKAPEPVVTAPRDTAAREWGTAFTGREKGEEKVFTVSSDLYTAHISTRGGVIRKWELKGYKSWDGFPVQLVPLETGGDLSVLFTSSDGRLINTHDLFFAVEGSSLQNITLNGSDSCTVAFALRANNGGQIVKRFTFHGDSYSFGVKFDFERMDSVISNFEYQIVWENGIRYAGTEQR